MKSVIEEIYNGEINCEFIKESEEYEEIMQKYDKLYNALLESLDDTQKKQLDDLYFTHGGIDGAIGKQHFKEGFKLGLRLCAEAFTDK